MPKIKCPQCGATNQDVTEQDACWKCGSILGVTAAEAPAPVQSVETAPPDTPGAPDAPMVESEQPLPLQAERKAPETPPAERLVVTRPSRPMLPIVLAICIVIVLIVVIVLLLRR